MSIAKLKFVRVSPTKARLIAREVQGMNAELALAALEFMPNCRQWRLRARRGSHNILSRRQGCCDEEMET